MPSAPTTNSRVRELRRLLSAAPGPLPPWPLGDTVVYGAGGCGQQCARRLQRAGHRVAAFIDERAAALNRVDGLPVVAPDDAAVRGFATAGIPVVLGVYNPGVNIAPIAKWLLAVGFSRVITFYELCECFGTPTHGGYWVAPRAYWPAHRDDIARVVDLLADDHSRDLLVAAVRLRLTWELDSLGQPDRVSPYAPADLPPLPQPLRLVDGGAYVGDTIAGLLDAGWEMATVAAFEPDLQNFSRLTACVRQRRLPAATLFPCGLGETTARLRFSSEAAESSALRADGTDCIQVVALDDVLPGLDVNFIKLDIEGAEPAALRGMRQTLQRTQPRLAVGVYHQPQHLWEIPFLVTALLPRHRLYLRLHGYNGFDLVAYALPPGPE